MARAPRPGEGLRPEASSRGSARGASSRGSARGASSRGSARGAQPEGKTRLRDVLSDEERLRLQEAFLRDAIEVALEAQIGPVHLAYTPAEAASWAEGEFGGSIVPFPQEGDDLGARMLSALRHVEARDFSPLLMIGTDAPLLQPGHLRSALSAVADADLCLGPSADGGYYLLACRTAQPQLFRDVPWSTNRVLDTTLRLAAESGLRYSLIETLYDIDTPADLALLREELPALVREPWFRVPRHTAETLLTLASE